MHKFATTNGFNRALGLELHLRQAHRVFKRSAISFRNGWHIKLVYMLRVLFVESDMRTLYLGQKSVGSNLVIHPYL